MIEFTACHFSWRKYCFPIIEGLQNTCQYSIVRLDICKNPKLLNISTESLIASTTSSLSLNPSVPSIFDFELYHSSHLHIIFQRSSKHSSENNMISGCAIQTFRHLNFLNLQFMGKDKTIRDELFYCSQAKIM